MNHPGSKRAQFVRQDRTITPDEVAWLRSSEGRTVCKELERDPADTPASIARWRAKHDPERVAAAWYQVQLRERGRIKYTRADEMLFDRVGLEQSTDEVIARHKAKRYAPFDSVADLCCGVGGDALALAEHAAVLALDWSETRTLLALHNAEVHGHSIETMTGDVTSQRPEASAIHLDPDRRSRGRRRHAAELASPSIEIVEQIVGHYEHAGIKLSPGDDLKTLAHVFPGEIEIISHKGECKQAMVWTGNLAQCTRSATVLPTGATLASNANDDLTWPAPAEVRPGHWLYEPDGAVIRANLVGLLATQHSLAPMDHSLAYLSGDTSVDSPFMQRFRVIDRMAWSGRKARRWLASHDIGNLDIKTRGFAGKPEEIQKQLKLKGTKQAVLILTRVNDAPLAVLAEREI